MLVSASTASHGGTCCCTQALSGQEKGRVADKVRGTSGLGGRDCCKELGGQEVVPNPNLHLFLQCALSCNLTQKNTKLFHVSVPEGTTYEAKTNKESFASLLL